MHHNVQFEIAIGQWLRLADHVAASSASPTPSSTTTATSGSSRAARGAPPLPAGDRLHIADWPALDHDDADDDCPDSVRKSRLAVQRCVAECLGQEVALSTLKSYQSVLSSVVRAAEAELQEELLPISSEEQLLKIFGFLSMTEGTALQWAKVRTLRAALIKYHVRLLLPSPFDSWTPRLRGFWKGLHNKRTHSGPGKEPVDFDKMLDYCQGDHTGVQHVVNIRNKVMAIVGYFGVRRGAEVVSFTMGDVISTDASGVQLRVRCQKNDPAGIGQVCTIPAIAAMGLSSPPMLFLEWLRVRRDLAPASEFLFVTTTGRNKGQQVSVDSLRKHVKAVFGDGKAAHSLRKGGAQFYSRRGVDSDVTRQQGGWRTSAVMEQTYTTMSKSEVHEAILAVGAKSSLTLEIQQRCKRLGAEPEQAALASETMARSLLVIIKNNMNSLSTRLLFESQAPRYLKQLAKHSNEAIRADATELYTRIHSNWMATQAAKRRRED